MRATPSRLAETCHHNYKIPYVSVPFQKPRRSAMHCDALRHALRHATITWLMVMIIETLSETDHQTKGSQHGHTCVGYLQHRRRLGRQRIYDAKNQTEARLGCNCVSV